MGTAPTFRADSRDPLFIVMDSTAVVVFRTNYKFDMAYGQRWLYVVGTAQSAYVG